MELNEGKTNGVRLYLPARFTYCTGRYVLQMYT